MLIFYCLKKLRFFVTWLSQLFLEKGIVFKKLWLWEDDYETVIE